MSWRARRANPREPLFSRRVLTISLIQGLGALAATLGVYLFAIYGGVPEAQDRAMTFTTLVIANLSLIFVNRSWTRGLLATLRTPNSALWWVIGGALALLAVTLFLPLARDLFSFGPLTPSQLGISILAGLAGGLWFELIAWTPLVRGRRAQATSPISSN